MARALTQSTLPASHESETVLLVEPDSQNRELYKALLEHHGFATIAVATPYFPLPEAEPADVVLTGLHMPQSSDGIELIARLRRDVRTKHIPIVVLTASAEPQAAERAMSAGCDVYLTKPCVPQRLVAELHRMAALHRERMHTQLPSSFQPLSPTAP